MSKKKVLGNKKCCFCGLVEDSEVKYGKIYTYKDIVTHYYCLLLSSNMEQRGRDNEGILGFLADDIHKELRRGKKLVCTYCRKNGATLGCCNTKCKKIFHFPCGVRAGALHQFFGEFKSFCVNHRTTQKVDNSVRQELKNLNEVLCCICYDQVNPESSTLTLWASCCKKAWFHKDCVQQLAISAGYFFKCPLCNNKKDFQQEMLENGIFIPHQDASWELVPHAFQELLYRHDSCDADECLCPKGRNHRSNNALIDYRKWELVLCRTCGSQGIHMACGQLKWGNRSVWDCKECRYILSKSKESTSSGVVHIRNNNCDVSSEDSDSDVSVGVEFPTSNNSSEAQRPTVSTTPVKLLPGPKSYKIRQLLSHEFGKAKQMYHATKCDKSNGVDGEQSESPTLKSKLVNENYSSCKPNDRVTLNIKPSPSSSRSNVITIDSDDEIEEIIQQSKEMNCRNTQARNSLTSTHTNQQTEQSMLNKTSNGSDTENNRINDEIIECASPTPVCNIKITNVTSLSHKLFSKHPDTNLDIMDSGNGYHNELSNFVNSSTSSSEAMLKRKSSIFLTSPVGNRFKRVRSDEFNRVSLDLIDSPCSGSQSLPPAFAPESHSSIFEHIDTISRSSKTSKEIDVQEVYQEQSSQSGSAIETSYTSENTPFSVISFHNALSNSNMSNPFLTSQDNDNNYNENPLEETLCEMNPLIMEDDDVLNSDCPSMISLENQRSGEFRGNVLDYTTISPINLPEVIELPSTVTGNQLLSKDNNSSTNCHKDADTSLVAESNNACCNDNASKIIGADKSKLYNGSPPNHWGDSSGDTSASAWSSDDNEDSFSTVATNYNACDRLRLIPESIRLQDLKFRVCSANVLQMVLYDTFSVNISMEQKTESELCKQPATPMKQYKSEKEFSMGVDNRNRNNCSPYVNAYDDRSSSVDNTDMKYNCRNDIKDDTKENFDPVTATSFKKSATNAVGSNCLSGKDINLFKRVISPLCSYDASEEEKYDKNWQNTQRFSLPTPDFKLNSDDDKSVQRKLRSSSREYCPDIRDSTSAQQDADERVSPSCFNMASLTRTAKEKHLSKSVSEKYRRYTNNNIDYETCETINQLSRRSKEKPVSQDKHLNSLKVSIDLNRIRNVINGSILHRKPKRTSLRNGDLKKILGASEIGLEPESCSSYSSQMSEESDDSKMDVAQSLTPVRSNGHNLRRSSTRNGRKLRRSNRHSEKHCLFDR